MSRRRVPEPEDATVMVLVSNCVGGVNGGLPVAVAVIVQIVSPVVKPVTLAIPEVEGFVAAKPGIVTGEQVPLPSHSPMDSVVADAFGNQDNEVPSKATAVRNVLFIILSTKEPTVASTSNDRATGDKGNHFNELGDLSEIRDCRL
jgi:hypothetical protein